MTQIRVTAALAVLAVVGLSSPPVVGAKGSATFHDLGWLAGDSLRAGVRAVSNAGSVILGWELKNDPEISLSLREFGFRWTEAEGVLDLLPEGGATRVRTGDITSDGAMIVGDTLVGTTGRGWRWTAEQGFVVDTDESATDENGNTIEVRWSTFAGASDSGHVIVGSTSRFIQGGDSHASRYQAQQGWTSLGLEGYPTGVSGSGSVIVGTTEAEDGSLVPRPFRYTKDSGRETLAPPDGVTWIFLHPVYVSANGRVVVWSAMQTEGNAQEVVYRRENGVTKQIHGVTKIGGKTRAVVSGVTHDGSIMVGWTSPTAGPSQAFYWDEIAGLRLLREMLKSDFEIELLGWRLEGNVAISDRGDAIAGTATRPDGSRTFWLVNIEIPPERPSCAPHLAQFHLPDTRRHVLGRPDLISDAGYLERAAAKEAIFRYSLCKAIWDSSLAPAVPGEEPGICLGDRCPDRECHIGEARCSNPYPYHYRVDISDDAIHKLATWGNGEATRAQFDRELVTLVESGAIQIRPAEGWQRVLAPMGVVQALLIALGLLATGALLGSRRSKRGD